MIIKWPGLEKRYETPESSVSSRRITALLPAPLGLLLSPSTSALEMKAAGDGGRRGAGGAVDAVPVRELGEVEGRWPETLIPPRATPTIDI